MATASDRDLLDDLRRGASGAFDAIYERYAPRLLRFLTHLTRSPAQAEDAFQDTWLRLASNAHRLRPETDLWAWLLTVARNGWISRRRSELRLLPSEHAAIDLADDRSGPEHRVVGATLLARVERCLAVMSDTDREVLLLIGVEDLDQRRAARVLGIGHAALRQRLGRARARLSEMLTAPDDHATPDGKAANLPTTGSRPR